MLLQNLHRIVKILQFYGIGVVSIARSNALKRIFNSLTFSKFESAIQARAR